MNTDRIEQQVQGQRNEDGKKGGGRKRHGSNGKEWDEEDWGGDDAEDEDAGGSWRAKHVPLMALTISVKAVAQFQQQRALLLESYDNSSFDDK